MIVQDDTRLIAGELIRGMRTSRGLSQTELARRCGVQSSVLSAYEHGRRQPAVAALARIAAATGFELRFAPAPDWQALERAGKILAQVLDLAEQMPYRPHRELRYPPLIRLGT